MFIYSFMFQFNNMIDFCIVPTSCKVANITLVFKKVKNSKKNYRPVSILPNISKVCKRCLFKQMSNYFSVFQCGCRKDLSSQYCWMSMIEKWKESVDKKKLLLPFLRTYPKLLIFSHMSSSLLNVVLMGSVYQF